MRISNIYKSADSPKKECSAANNGIPEGEMADQKPQKRKNTREEHKGF